MSEQESNRIRRIVGWGIIGLIAVIGLLIALSLYFAPLRPGGFHYHFFFPFHFGWLGPIFLILIVFLIARWFFWPWRERGGEGASYYLYPKQQRPDAESIVKERYAKGEITKEQFEQMLRDLRQEGG
jgi:putative membrane protein